MVISDAIGAIRSMADGKMYDSKSELRRGYKAKGVIELGNDAASYRAKEPERPKVTKAEVAAAVRKVKAGYRPRLPAD